MTATHKPWHVAPECPECKGPGKPWEDGISPNMLVCCACGWHWDETNLIEIAKAWFGHGAYEAREYLEERGGERQRTLRLINAAIEALKVASTIADDEFANAAGRDALIKLMARIISKDVP